MAIKGEKALRGVVLVVGLTAGALCADAQERATRLLGIRVEPHTNGVTGIIDADGRTEHRIYVVDDPMQVVVDVLDVRNTLEPLRPDASHPVLRRVLSDQLSMTAYDPTAKGRTFARFTFELKQPVWHSLRVGEGRLEIGLHPTERTVDGPAPTTTSPIDEEPAIDEPEPLLEAVVEPEPETLEPVMESRAEVDDSGGSVEPEPAENPLSRWIEPSDVSPDVFFGAGAGGPSEYVLGPDDVVEIIVFELDQLNRTIRIEADGTIILPLVGPVRVGGLTAAQAASAVAGKLRGDFVDDPQVSLLITDHQSRRVSLLGAVARPGAYPLIGRRDLLEVVASAGGMAEGAGTLLYVFRKLPDGRNARLSIPLQELLVLGDPKWNIGLRPGDVVSIPPENAISISVVGSVGKPGVYKLPAGNGATLLRAVALAGGLEARASKDIQVKRPSSVGAETVIKVDLGAIMSGKIPDFVLQEGDVVIVNQSFF